MGDHVRFEVEGVKQLARDLRRLGDADLKAALRAANKSLSEAVVTRALPNVPVGKTGRLKASIRGLASQQSATVKAGSAGVPYAATIHWGRKKRGVIKARPFLRAAAQTVEEGAAEVYQAEIDTIIRRAGLS